MKVSKCSKFLISVIETADTLKKAKEISTRPVIYSKFLLTELAEALKNLVTNSKQLETLILEGLPFRGHYMETLVQGLAQNSSIKTLSFTRGNIGDEACESICATVQHMLNVDSFSLASCDLSVKGATAVANLVKFQRIQRFSEAWSKSLRYQNVDAESIPGLKKICLNNNPSIANEGLAMLTDALIEDAWIKDIEMQNCGLGDEAAQHIIKCLNENKTILTFNIAGNSDVSEHLYRHICLNLGNCDNESSDSGASITSSPENMTKKALMEQLKFLQDRLENEIFRRKQTEALNEKLNKQVGEFQKELVVHGAFRVPEGFTLVANATLEDILTE